MALSRRNFVRAAGIGAAGALTTSFIGARGRENFIWSALETPLEAAQAGRTIIISSNENPMGPGPTVLDAMTAAFGPDGSRPGRYSPSSRDLTDALAAKHKVKPENIVLGCGSTQILRTVTHVFTAKDKPLVATIPTYEECADYANLMGHPIVGVPLNSDFQPDLDRFADASRGGGLVFYCNPSNPSSTYVGARATRDFIARLNSQSPGTTILVDEAYFEYVTNPDHETFIPMAVQNPRVIVARTFSKAYGMAGLRIGYAVGHADTIRQLRNWDAGSGSSTLNVLATHGAIAAVQQDDDFITKERARNAAVRDFTMKWFADRGMKPADSQANFMFVNIGTPVAPFRAACAEKGVRVARDFPPFEKTHCRIAFGTMEEMQAAVKVFGEVLGKPAAAAAA
ncbi:MAG TPA: histidinol-phosphate transaminase [Vicinamibacterales bacterium]|nr:histidinol-phosphate transaminase [Vicinamibacterales bacterium]